MQVFRGHSGPVTSVAFSSDSKLIVSGSYDNTICVWDIHLGTQMCNPFQGHLGVVTPVAFSLNDRWIVSASSDLTICV